MLKKLKSYFIIEEETPTEASAQDKPSTSKPKEVQRTTMPPSAAPAEGSTIDKRIVEKLLDAIDRNDLEGFDYLEYRRALSAMEKLPMDEATKYRSAFATAATLGISLDKLIGSANHYIGILNNENAQFQHVFQNEVLKQISGKEDELSKQQALINQKREDIKRLQIEISNHENDIKSLEAEVATNRQKVEATRGNFQMSFDHVKNMLLRDIEKMKSYLQ